MEFNKYNLAIEEMEKIYEEQADRIDKFIEDIRNSQPTALAIVSPENITIFKQLMDLDIFFSYYLKYADAYSFATTGLILKLADITDDVALKNFIINLKPKFQEMFSRMSQASNEFTEKKMKFNTDVFEYIEKK